MLIYIIIIGALFFVWRFISWWRKGFPVDTQKLRSSGFIFSVVGIMAAVLLVGIYGQSNPEFSWMLIAIGAIGGIIIAMIEAFSLSKKEPA